VLTNERWQIVERLFHEALACPAPHRRAFVDSSCGDDVELRSELESLLEAEGAADSRAALAESAAATWAAETAPPPIIGREVDGYRILSLIGAGGMGEVYLAEELALGRRVALKLLPAAVSADAGRVRRFTEEARAASSLNHPNIITVHAVGEFEGRRYIATEFIEGDTLRDRIARGPLAPAEALDVATQVASALRAAHDAGIIHRDIKPENIIIRRDGYVRVLDFGLAKLPHPDTALSSAASQGRTAAGAVLGTIDYMAPEQAAGAAVDGRADIYSLSVVLHELITGVLPRDSAFGSDPSSPAVALPSALKRVLRRGLRSDPAARYQTAGELLRDLQDATHTLASGVARARGLRWTAAAAFLIATSAGVLVWRNPALWRLRLGVGPAAADVSGTTTLAVLPFQAMTLSADDQYLGLGIADAVITQLGELPQLRVRPTTSVRAYMQSDVNPVAAGRALKVDHVLSGLIQREGDRVRVTLQLVDVDTGVERWSTRVDERYSDLFTLQDTVSRRVADKLTGGAAGAHAEPPDARQTKRPETYRLYLQGRYLIGKPNTADIERSLLFFQRVVDLEPEYAPGHAALGAAHRQLGGSNYSRPGDAAQQHMRLARDEAQATLAIDPNNAEAYEVLAAVHFQYEWNWDAARTAFTRAVAANPNLAVSHLGYGWFLEAMGQPAQALAEERLALQLDPTSIIIHEVLANVLEFAGRSKEAIAVLDEATLIDPAAGRPYRRRVRILEHLGRLDDAVTARKDGARIAGRPDEAARVGEVYARGGYQAVLEDEARRPGDPLLMASADLKLKRYDAAIAALEQCIDQKHTWAVMFNTDPQFDPVRQDPRFIALVHRIGF
jgi:TolB-like protein